MKKGFTSTVINSESIPKCTLNLEIQENDDGSTCI